MAQLAEAQAKVGARPKPAADAPETDGDLLARLQEIRRVLGSTDIDQPGARSDADRPGSTAESPPAQVGIPTVPAVATAPAMPAAPAVPAAQAVQLSTDERFDLGSPFPESGVRVVRRWRPTVIVGVVLLAVAAAVWYGVNRERPAPVKPASSGVVTDRAGAPPAPRPIEPPADKPAAPVTAVAPVTAPAPAPSQPVAADGKGPPPAAKGGVATTRPEAPGGEAPRLRLSAPPASEASPPGPPQPTAAVRMPAEKAAAVPVPPAPKAVRPQAGGSPAPGVIERQPAYTGQCNEGAAALGLCAPAPAQRRE
jgi:hypothetical protein